ncbi:FKBP-type peptidyl-prolyl cis-trans isomerase [Sphingomonas sp. MMS24-J13]|uniref:FKBP-type peptidyl-prolyl cis-trans isomerase n=1 Tax=Sphingomonas sp. MMS24-J13 TaxID=3238686 RepID=UPI00384AB6D1
MSKVTAVPLRPVSRAGVTTLWIGIALFVLVGIYAAWKTSEKAVMTGMTPAQFLVANGTRAGVKTTPSGLEYEVIEAGKGPTPTTGDGVQIDYRGTLTNGTQFDATKPGQPVVMPIGQVIPGFGEALTLMPRGSRYRFWIPPELAYGDHQAGQIPANSVLVFEVTMHDFGPMPPQMPQGMPQGAAQ